MAYLLDELPEAPPGIDIPESTEANESLRRTESGSEPPKKTTGYLLDDIPDAPSLPTKTATEAPKRGMAAEIGTQFAAGFVDLADTYANAAQALDRPGGNDVVRNFSDKVLKITKQLQESEALTPREEPSLIKRGLPQGFRALAPSVGAGLPGALIGMVGGIPGMVGGFAAGGGTVMGLAEYNRSVNEFIEHGIDPEIAHSVAVKSALVEGGGEALSDLLMLASSGWLSAGTATGKKLIADILRKPFKQAIKDLTKSLIVETGTEVGQAVGQASIREDIGVPTAGKFESGVEAIVPSIVMATLFHVGSSSLNTRRQNKISRVLSDGEADPAERTRAAEEIFVAIKKEDKELATIWGQVAGRAIKEERGMDLENIPISQEEVQEQQVRDEIGDREVAASKEGTVEDARPPEIDMTTGEEVHVDIPAPPVEEQPEAVTPPPPAAEEPAPAPTPVAEPEEQSQAPQPEEKEPASDILPSDEGEKQEVEPSPPTKTPPKGDPSKDSLSTYVRKEGGLNYDAEALKGELDRLTTKEGVHGIVRKNKTGRTIDQMLERAREDGYFEDDATPADFLTALEGDLRDRPHFSTAKVFIEKDAQGIPVPEEARERVPAGSLDLEVGDSFTIDGEQFDVLRRNEDGNLIIEDGLTYEVDPFDMLPKPDEGSVKSKEQREFELTAQEKPKTKKKKEEQETEELFKGKETFQVGAKPIIAAEVKEGEFFAKPTETDEEKQASLLEETEKSLAEARKDVDPDPTAKQIKSGTYKKGHLKLQGLDISIENAKGSERKVDGKAFKMHHDYGYIKRTNGADGEQVDVYIGPELDAPKAFIVHQLDPKTGAYDEDKVMLGFPDMDSAKEAYLKQYDNPKFFGAMTGMTVQSFKKAIDSGSLGAFTRNGIAQAKAKGKLTPKQKPARELLPEAGEGDIVAVSEKEPPYDARKRQRAERDAKRAAKELTSYSVRDSGGALLRPGRNTGTSTTGLGFQRDLIEKGRVDLTGHSVNTAEDLAVIAQVFRDPRFETFRIFYIKNGKIVAHEGLTSRLPTSGIAFYFKNFKKTLKIESDFKSNKITKEQRDSLMEMALREDIHKIKAKMKRLEADGYYLLHNHPSGNPSPSIQDIRATEKWAELLRGFKGHVVINSGQYAVLDRESRRADVVSAYVRRLPGGPKRDTLLSAEVPNDLLRQPIRSQSELAEIGKKIQAKDKFVTLIYTSRGRVRAIQEVPVGLYESAKGIADHIRGAIRAFGGQDVFSVYNGSRNLDAQAQKLVESGVIRDAVFSSKRTIQERGVVAGEPRDRPAKQYRVQERSEGAPTFFSKLTRTIEDKMPNVASPQQIAGIIKGAGVKVDEIKWSGIQDFLEAKKGKVTKQEVLDYLAQNEVKVEEVEKKTTRFKESVEKEARSNFDDEFYRANEGWGQWMYEADNEARDAAWDDESHIAWKSLDKTKSQYLEDTKDEDGDIDADEAKELFYEEFRDLEFEDIYTSEDLQDFKNEAWDQEKDSYIEVVEQLRKDEEEDDDTKFSAYQLPGGKNYRELLLTLPSRKKRLTDAESTDFKSPHFDELNILVHVRFNDRTDADGKKVLFIEEVQSDWHQKGREKGYDAATPKVGEKFMARQQEVERLPDLDKQPPRTIRVKGVISEGEFHVPIAEIKTGVPDAPFKKPWHELALKRMLRYAAENGYDKLAWTTGEQQAERYDLSKQVDAIQWTLIDGDSFKGGESRYQVQVVKDNRLVPVFHGERVKHLKKGELAEYIGKDAARSIVNEAENRGKKDGTLEGPDLKVGGSGMKGFYDKMIPSFLNKYGKKWGARVGEATIDMGGKLVDIPQAATVQAIPITHSMQESVLGAGQPLFKPSTDRKTALSSQLWQNIVSDLERILPQGSRVKLVPRLERDAAQNRAAARAWGMGEEGVIVLSGLYRTVKFDNDTATSLVMLSMDHMNEGTPYHEAWHGVENLLLTDKERKIIAEAFPGEKNRSSSEAAADGFAQWVSDKKVAPPLSPLGRIFRKIKNFFDKLTNALKDRGFTSAEDIFGKAYSGELKERSEASERNARHAAETAQFQPVQPKRFARRERTPSSFEEGKDDWFGNKDLSVLENKVELNNLQAELKKVSGETFFGKKSKDIDRAIQIYIDTKRSPEDLDEFYSDLTPEQKRIVDLSQNLTDAQKALADKIAGLYETVGLEAMESGVIHNVLENYAARTWKKDDKPVSQLTEVLIKFGLSTRHARKRTISTIIAGWAKGKELAIEGATNNLNTLKDEIARVTEDKRLLRTLKELKTSLDLPLVTTRKDLPGYVKIEHPNFKSWKWKGKIEQGQLYDRSKFVDEEGNVYERVDVYAPAAMAKNLNKVLGRSVLRGRKNIDFLTKYNAVLKSWILMTSLFHHLAFMRSYMLGIRGKKFSELNPLTAYKDGINDIKNLKPEVGLLVRNGLTLQIQQEWDERVLQEQKVIFEDMIDKMGGIPKAIKDRFSAFRHNQANWLFNTFGAGLKVRAALIEYRNALREHPEMEPDERAKMVANLVNDDFGGLHLGRIGRDPTTQHLFRLLALAPDWTESNVRAMTKAILPIKEGSTGFQAASKAEQKLYRKFWASIITKGVFLTFAISMMLSFWDEDDDPEDKLKEAWEAGRFRWLMVDITPIYRMLGGKTANRKYFSIFGHFVDPMKFIRHPLESAVGKGSAFFIRPAVEVITGANWQHKKFTTLNEFLGVDEKGPYLTKSAGHERGAPKGGKDAGKLTKLGQGKVLSPEQFPSWMLSQVRQWQPVQVQNFIAWQMGELEGFDALSNSLGLGVRTTYAPPSQSKALHKFLRLRKEVRHARVKYDYIRKNKTKSEAEAFKSEHRTEIRLSGRAALTHKSIRALEKKIKKIESSTRLSEEEKTERVKAANDRINERAAAFNDLYREAK